MTSPPAGASQRSRRRWFFGLQSLLIAFVAIGAILALFRESLVRAERQRRVIREVQQLGGVVWFSNDREAMHGFPAGRDDLPADQNELRYFLPGSYRGTIDRIALDEVDQVPEPLLLEISRLHGLTWLSVTAPLRDSQTIRHLRERPELHMEICWELRHAPITTIGTPEAFSESLQGERVILFLDNAAARKYACWNQRQVIAESAVGLSGQGVKFYRLELTKPCSPVAGLNALQYRGYSFRRVLRPLGLLSPGFSGR